MKIMTCKCGENLSNSNSPNEIHLRVYSDREWDTFLSEDLIETNKISSPTYNLWRCHKCERLYVFDRDCNTTTIVYSLEN